MKNENYKNISSDKQKKNSTNNNSKIKINTRHKSLNNNNNNEYDILLLKNKSLKEKFQELKIEEKKINNIIYSKTLETSGRSFILKELNFHKNNNEYLSKDFFDLISKLKIEIRRNRFEFLKQIEETKNLYPSVIDKIKNKYNNFLGQQKITISNLEKENKIQFSKLENLNSFLMNNK